MERKAVVLEQAWGMTRADAEETLRNLRRCGMVPADLDVRFVRVGSGGPVVTRGGRPCGSTAGARFVAREALR